jgi:hypothetical protein
MPSMRSKTAILAIKQLQTYALDGKAADIGTL